MDERDVQIRARNADRIVRFCMNRGFFRIGFAARGGPAARMDLTSLSKLSVRKNGWQSCEPLVTRRRVKSSEVVNFVLGN
jgi:hypothetical protein